MGSPRPTFDVDLCYRRTDQNLARVAAALADLHVTLRGAPRNLPFTLDARTLRTGMNFTLDSDLGALDLLGEVPPIGDYDAIASRAETWAVGDLTIRTISLEDLIRVKQHIKRFKDSESLFQLLAIRRVRAEAAGRGPVSGDDRV